MSDGAFITEMLVKFVNRAQRAAWAEGHLTAQRRVEACTCGAWSEEECGCGKFGTGELLSLEDNPYL